MSKKGIKKKILSIMMVLAMVCSMLPSTLAVHVSADDETDGSTTYSESTVWETSKSKEATNLDENYESDVTLSFPSAEEELVYDIVFVLDKSTSTAVEDDILSMLKTLQSQVENTGASINVGVVIFNKKANVTCELTDLETGYDTIEAAVKTTLTSGTNLHAGLLAGKEMLDEDTSVAASRKYLIVVSDGITYMYDSDAKVSTYYWLNDNSPYYSADPYAWSFKYGNNNPPTSWADWITEIGTILATEKESEMLYDDYQAAGAKMSDATYAEELETDGYTTNIDRALYYSYQTYTAAQEAGYTCFAVMKETTSTYTWGPSFMNYLAEGETVDFSTIEEEILYLLDAGSKVKDVMGYGTDSEGNEYDFDFIDDASRLTLTVGETTYTTTSVSTEELDGNETSRYIFTAEGVEATNEAEAPFVLHYYANGEDGASDECFVLDINVPVSNFARVQLTYGVVLTNPQTEDATYGTYDQYGNDNDGSESYSLYTNAVATLYPVDTAGNEYTPEDFQNPTVSYEIISVTVEKIWDDADDQDGKRPESITINLLADGEIVDSAKVTADDNWEYTFTGLRQWSDDDEGYETIEYTITENYIDEYESVISGDAESGYVVTNSYEPETIDIEISKIFDESDKDGESHDSVTITLYANGVSTGKTITLSDSNNWYGTFTGLAKYEDGVEIEYTIKESGSSDYISIVTGDADSGYTIVTYTNTSSSSSSTTTSSSADDETDDTSESTSKTTELTTGSESDSVSTTSAQGETESNSVNWIVPVAGVGVAAILGVVIFEMKKRAQLSE